MRGTNGLIGRAAARAFAGLGLVLALMGIASLRLAAAELVMFDEPGCPWCRKWDAEVGPAYPRSWEGRRAPLQRVHVARAGELGIHLASPVHATPTFVLVEAGAEVGRITGYPGNAFFWSMLDELLARLAPPPKPVDKPRDARLDPPAEDGGRPIVLSASALFGMY